MWSLGELRTEGPFGDHTGFYTMEDEYPVFHITCITHRKGSDLCGDGGGCFSRWKMRGWARSPAVIFLPLMKLTLLVIVDSESSS